MVIVFFVADFCFFTLACMHTLVVLYSETADNKAEPIEVQQLNATKLSNTIQKAILYWFATLVIGLCWYSLNLSVFS